MIELSRALARKFRTVLRRCTTDARDSGPVILCRAGGHGLTLQSSHGAVGLRYHEPGKRPADAVAFRAKVLADFEGRDDGVVALENVAAGQGRARWDDGGVAREVHFDTVVPEDVADFPEPPAEFVPLAADFLAALDAAAQTAGKTGARLALSRLQLRGKKGQVVATDGRQLLVQSGFALPWADDVLVPAVAAFGSRELTDAGEVAVGRGKNHVVVTIGPWAILLAIDGENRCPDVEVVIPRPLHVKTRLEVAPEEATFLVGALPKLPGHKNDPPTFTIDLNSPPALRARGDGPEPATELVLARSVVSGPPVVVCAVRDQVYRALKLGLRSLEVVSADKPIVWRDARRTYLCMPLASSAAVGRGPAAAGSRPAAAPTAVTPPPPNERTPPTMPAPQPDGAGNGRAGAAQPESWSLAEVITETETLRGLLQDAAARTARLLAALKHQRRQTRAVRAAMDSLRQLQLDR